ncbi:mitochondrial protein [Histoplasma capsulatum]|uniref:MICOS complex subunit n=1 Tax=Ajellomyces capsulatus TaxID=5037 RepID=A0A8A1MA44_AJECA|nr:mitochondrial protein [Histoplasma capsulatum]
MVRLPLKRQWMHFIEDDEILSHRKPIYEDESSTVLAEKLQPQPQSQLQERDTQQTFFPPKPLRTPSSTSTADMLAQKVHQARLFLYTHSLAMENSLNDALSHIFHVESRFTNTIASLAPPRESGERLLPGSIYVLVSAMAGSIVSRNRGIFLRTTTPLAVGTIAAWTLLPVTMQNVSDLVFEYEQKVPGLAERHVRVRTGAEEAWYTAKAHSAHARGLLESKIGRGREKLEEWVRKGN